MENEHIFNPEDDFQMAMVHVVFLPAISESLARFQVGWNHHTMRGRNRGVPIRRFKDDREQAPRLVEEQVELPPVEELIEMYGHHGKEKLRKFPEVQVLDPLEGCQVEEQIRKR
jgi:hypothetical protein